MAPPMPQTPTHTPDTQIHTHMHSNHVPSVCPDLAKEKVEFEIAYYQIEVSLGFFFTIVQCSSHVLFQSLQLGSVYRCSNKDGDGVTQVLVTNK